MRALCQSTAVCRTLTFYRDSASTLRPCLQNYSKMPESKLYYEVVVTKNFFRDCVKYVAMRLCHIALWHDGLKGSEKTGMPFRTTSIQDDPHVENNTIQLLASLLNDDHAGVGVCHKTVLHILHDILGYCKLALHWIPNEISEM